mmetsp:Transcript_6793/g.12781  ORF Transcript_6793/g.12781 Transcript_6793/m.12781 type:complete len:288 (+) Transcript_6793:147-1010(+)
MDANNRSQFKHTTSVRERIIQDVESTETLLEMVQNAHKVLVEDKKYPIFRNMISELVFKHRHLNKTIKGARNRELFSCGDLILDDRQQEIYHIQPPTSRITEVDEMNRLIDGFIIELLRFLSMKILLESVPGTMDDADQICQRMPSMVYVTPSSGVRAEGGIHSIIPSAPLCDGWKALLLLPKLYHDVCCAMGCDGKLDFDEEAVMLDVKSNHKATRDYRDTLVTYEKLFLVVPDEYIWSRLEVDEEGDRGDTFYDGFRDFFDSVSAVIKKKIKGPSHGVPDSILIN